MKELYCDEPSCARVLTEAEAHERDGQLWCSGHVPADRVVYLAPWCIAVPATYPSARMPRVLSCTARDLEMGDE